MFEQLKQMLSKSLKTLQTKGDTFKEKLELIMNKETISIEDIVFFIQHHPETEITSKQLLGFTFMFYKLSFDNIHLSVDTKDDKVLEVIVTINQATVFQYHSYSDEHHISDIVKIPSVVLEQ